MLFAGIELAARIERAECRLIQAGTEAVARRMPDAPLLVQPLAGGVATHATPGSPLNKLAGLGFAGTPDERELARVEREFARRGTPLQAEVASLAEPAVAELLTRRGYVLKGFEAVLGRRLDGQDLPSPPAGIEVAPSPPEELDRWIDVAVSAFLVPDAQGVPSHESFPRELLEDVMTDMAHAQGLERWSARRAGALAGAASMRIGEGVAQLCGAATLPEHRRRGVQSALLAARLAVARARGCDVAVITTQPGSRSCENAQRQGFELLYVRSILVLGS